MLNTAKAGTGAIMTNMTHTRIEVRCPNGQVLVYRNDRGVETINIAFELEGSMRHRPLQWARMISGKSEVYSTLVTLYRQLRRGKTTSRSLHRLIGGAHSGRNGGWAVGTAGYREFLGLISTARRMIARSRKHLGITQYEQIQNISSAQDAVAMRM